MTAPLNQIPPTFCWTKMGTESGEALSNIILRKEWERGFGNGQFYWGIGQSLGKNAERATQNGSLLTAIFSPMPSKPQRHDVTPKGVYLWNSFVEANGDSHPLPLHAFVTSGASTASGARKERQYALLCTCATKLDNMKSTLVVPPHALRNISTGNPLGASQVTAVVSYRACDERADGRRYPVSFSAQLKAPYFVQLAHPTLLSPVDVTQVELISRTGDIKAWVKLVERLRIGPAVASFGRTGPQ
jgi:hypothetical protein